MKRCCVDFDNTIAKSAKFPEMGDPINGVREGLRALKDMGFEIAIHSCRTSTELFKNLIDRMEQVREIRDYMEGNELPYDEILMADKPLASFYIDDSAIRYKGSWEDVVMEVKDRM